MVTISGKLQYYDPKKQKNSIRGELALKGASVELINAGHLQYARLRKFSDKVEEGTVSYFSVKPANSPKTYFFAVPSGERESWVSALRTAEKADVLVREQQALQLKLQYSRQQDVVKMQLTRQAKIGSMERSISAPLFPAHAPSSLAHANSDPHLSMMGSADPVSGAGGSAGTVYMASSSLRSDATLSADSLGFCYSKAPEAGLDVGQSAFGQDASHIAPPGAIDDFMFDCPEDSASASAVQPSSAGPVAPISLPVGTQTGLTKALLTPSIPDPQNWTPHDVAAFAFQVGLGRYSQEIVSQNINGWNCLHFNSGDLSRYLALPLADADHLLAAVRFRLEQVYGGSVQ